MTRIKRGLGLKFMTSFITIAFLLISTIPAFSQEQRAEKGYTYNLKQLIEQVKKNIKKADDELKKREIGKRNQQRENEAREYFEKGNALYEEGKLKEAKQAWYNALKITKEPGMKGYIKKTAKRALEETRARKKEERERQKKLKAEQKKKRQQEFLRQYQLKEEQLKKKQLERRRQRELERQKRKEERARQKRLRAEQREKQRLERERQQELERQQKEKIKILNKEAKNLYRDKNYDEATAKFKEILELDPENKTTLRYLKLISQKIEKAKD